MSKVQITRNVPDEAINFVVSRDGRNVKLSQGDELTVVQDLGQGATEILLKTSNDQRDNAWVLIEYVRFPEL